MAESTGRFYSERNPVPTIQTFEKAQEQQAADEKAQQVNSPPGSPSTTRSSFGRDADTSASTSGSSDPANEKAAMVAKMAGPKEKPTDRVKHRKGERTVKDPTTGLDTIIKDAEFKDFKQSPAEQAPAQAAVDPGRVAPNPARPGNVSLHPYLPAQPPSLADLLQKFDYLQIGLAVSHFIVWFLFGFPQGRWYIPFSWPFFSLVLRGTLIGAMGFASITAVSIIQRTLEKEVESVRVDMHRERGEKFAPPTPESAEWLNAFVRTIWALVNPDMFASIVDMIEDIMQQSLPGFVDAVKISDIGQGDNPFRIVSLRALPDRPADKEYPREEWIDQGTNDLLSKADELREKGIDADQSGDYVNFEVAFAYQARPGKGSKTRAKNIHLLLEFFVGLYDWLHVPIPIWIQVDGIVGTIRLRLQFIPEAPFIRNVTFTFMGVPAVEVSAIPMSQYLPNVFDLPLISRFVKMAIAAGTAEFVAPKSMTLNMQEILSGAAIGDTRAVGVFLVVIHYAEGLSAQDSNGRSDPYIVAAYAKFGKPLYSTRIILGDLNPVYEETTALLVTNEEIKSDEELSLMLWDSDQHSADDLIGRVQLPVKSLMENKNKMTRRKDALAGFEDADNMDGILHWSIGFFDKVPLRKDLELPPDAEHQPPDITKTPVEREIRPGDKAPNPGARDLPPPPPDVQRTRPDPDFPSGVLSVVIHQINNLERQNLGGTSGKEREGQAGQDTDDPSEQSANLPSAYCEIIINDDLVYKTRVKQYTTMPFFEAGTEKFIRDWESTVVRLVVRDSRLREKDPILGVVNLKLKDLFAGSSEVTRLFSLTEGIGFGRMNVSLLFRGVNCKLPPAALGWDTGTVEILAPISLDISAPVESSPSQLSPSKLSSAKLVLSTTDSSETVPASSSPASTGSDIVWDSFDDILRLPVYSRYSTSLTFEVTGGSFLRKSAMGMAVLWLKDLTDDIEQDIEIPLVVSKDLRQLRQNVVYELEGEGILKGRMHEAVAKTHDVHVVGYIRTRIRLSRGLDEDHEKHAKTQARRHAFETYDHVEGEAQIAERNSHANDDGVIDKDEQRALDKAHKRQLANRQRGINGFRPYRTGIWMKEGIKSRLMPAKGSAKREPAVQSEA
ncbi:hypothetical protein CYLTODRAFT_493697 [Cylindrobasidium torrendii FP15055 ss-10]|uniref:C2 domain-containing protein n=1 Tax=Cylindrobasidium torrendii FP15055 ss-10 TaxID=1314674 RepID=A0A0D7B0M8_9AGAR|nr:hypothetical protein CYLTODRAFT_493697 [Cylindrobasidium torrendii FP15055 ss-10]